MHKWECALQKLPSGTISGWFAGEREYDGDDGPRRLLTDHNEKFLLFPQDFVDYVYLVDMDNLNFCCVSAYYNHTVLCWSLDSAHPDFEKEWLKSVNALEHASDAECFHYLEEHEKPCSLVSEAFPVPGCVADPMIASIAENGYRITEQLSMSAEQLIQCTPRLSSRYFSRSERSTQHLPAQWPLPMP